MAQNNAVGQRTKHIDIRHRYVGELVNDLKTVELRHVRSEDNTADINSKNTKVETHKKFAKSLYEGFALAYALEEDVATVNQASAQACDSKCD